MSVVVMAALGGVLIGGASALLLRSHGRIAGISGILGGLLQDTQERGWRLAFVAGLVLAGVVAMVVAPSAIGSSLRTPPMVVLAGLLVGIGTRMGNGCTSGHGVCGLARGSVRSLVAVATFMTTGVLATLLVGGAA